METVVEEVAAAAVDFTPYLDQLSQGVFDLVNASYASMLLLAAFMFYVVFFGGRYR